jgi:hypothetical protein
MKASMRLTTDVEYHGIDLSVSNFLLSFSCNNLSRKLTDLAAAFGIPSKTRRSYQSWERSQTVREMSKDILGLGSRFCYSPQDFFVKSLKLFHIANTVFGCNQLMKWAGSKALLG